MSHGCHKSSYSKKSALSVANFLVSGRNPHRRRPASLHVYECEHCGQWHLTSSPTERPGKKRPEGPRPKKRARGLEERLRDWLGGWYVPRKGLEPLLLTEPDPKSGASANFATSAARERMG